MRRWANKIGLGLLLDPLHLATILLGIALATIFATYVGYPMATVLRARLRPMPTEDRLQWEEELPTVTCVVTAHDEGDALVAKVRNLLAADYPKGKLEVVIADDGSTDGSAAAAVAVDPERVRVVRTPERGGKAQALARAVPEAKGELLVLCDVRQRFDHQAIRELVRPFVDPDVGAASGQLLLDGSRGPGAYWRYESMIRRAEAKVDSVVGVSGSIYAIRRNLFPEHLPHSLILDDVYVPMKVVLAGYRVVHVENAKAYDKELSVDDEFPRKVRTLAGNYQLLALFPAVLDPFRNRLFWAFFWHKVARLLCPWALATAFVSSALAPGLLPRGLFLAQLAFYALAIIGKLQGRNAWRIASLCQAFVMLNLAAVVGLFEARRRAQGAWAPTSHLARDRIVGEVPPSNEAG